MSNFSQKLLSYLVLPTAIVDDCLAVVLENSEIKKSDKELFIGFAAMQCIQKNNMEGTSGVSIFRKEVRSFYVGCLTYIKNKFPLNDAIIKHAVLIEPLNRKTVSQQSLLELISALPEQIIQPESREALCAEFCEYQSMESTLIPSYEIGDCIDLFWSSMQKLKDPATQNLMYPTLCRLAKHVVLIPHSNAYCETLFSMVKKTYHRHEESAG